MKAGHGGNGDPKYGGVGGKGGAVFLKAKESSTLKLVWKKNPTKSIEAGHGEDSNKMRLVGRRGTDREIEIPTGVTIIDRETNKVLGELNQEEETCLVASGGRQWLNLI